jgi:2-polyprenyl-3-methyl-5-hydroxy-6-metoxy-1,4-benzoquinol methylase
MTTPIQRRIEAHHADSTWMSGVMDYLGMDEDEFADLIGCFFGERPLEAAPVALPKWAEVLDGEAFERKRDEVCRERSWTADMPVLGIVHLEYIAREDYKLELHQEWLEALEGAIRPGGEFRVLDYGCGASSFSDLALARPEVCCTVADADPGVVDYLAWKYGRRARGRVTARALASPDTRISSRARVKVDFRRIAGKYDAIVLADVLEHTLDPLAVLLHMIAQLGRDGLLFVNYPREIEGDWHTPEAYSLWPWCQGLLRGSCNRLGRWTWRKVSGRRSAAVSRVLAALHPLLRRRARRFARNHFREHGRELVEVVQARAQRRITVEELIASVDQ